MNSVKKPTDQLPVTNSVVAATDSNLTVNRRWLIVGLLIIVMVSLTARVVFVNYFQQQKPAKSPAKVYAATANNYQSVASGLKSQISTASDNKSKAVLYDQLSQNAQTAGNSNDAIEAATNAEQLDPSGARAASLALLYQDINDWPNAVIWFQKAVDQTPKSADPRIDDAYNNYMSDFENAKSHL